MLQESLSWEALLKVLKQIVIWLVLGYLCLLTLALSLLNLVLLFIFVWVLLQYIQSSVKAVRVVNSKANSKKIKKYL